MSKTWESDSLPKVEACLFGAQTLYFRLFPSSFASHLFCGLLEDNAVIGCGPVRGRGHNLESCGRELIDQQLLWHAVPSAVFWHALGKLEVAGPLARRKVYDREKAARLE